MSPILKVLKATTIEPNTRYRHHSSMPLAAAHLICPFEPHLTLTQGTYLRAVRVSERPFRWAAAPYFTRCPTQFIQVPTVALTHFLLRYSPHCVLGFRKGHHTSIPCLARYELITDRDGRDLWCLILKINDGWLGAAKNTMDLSKQVRIWLGRVMRLSPNDDVLKCLVPANERAVLLGLQLSSDLMMSVSPGTPISFGLCEGGRSLLVREPRRPATTLWLKCLCSISIA